MLLLLEGQIYLVNSDDVIAVNNKEKTTEVYCNEEILEYFESLHYKDYAFTLTSENSYDIFYGGSGNFVWIESCIPGLGYQTVVQLSSEFELTNVVSVEYGNITLKYNHICTYENAVTDNHVLKSVDSQILSNFAVKENVMYVIVDKTVYKYVLQNEF